MTAMLSTGDTGVYTFASLTPATYFVTEVVPGEFVQTGPVTGHHTIVLVAGQTAADKDFANFRKCATQAVKQISYVINGTLTVGDLRGKTNQGDLVTVRFTVTGDPTELTLVSYSAPGPTFVAADAHLQRMFDVDTGLFSAGTHTLTVQIPNSYYQIDFVCGKPIDRFGPAGSNIFYTPQMRLFSADNDGFSPVLTNSSSLDGSVFIDANGDGAFGPDDAGIGLAKVKLSGTSNQGKTVSLVRYTKPDGSYRFDNLSPGNYSIAEFQPDGFHDGLDRIGSVGGTLGDDVISGIALSAGLAGVGYNFGERPGSFGSCSLIASGNSTDVTLQIDGTTCIRYDLRDVRFR